MKKTIVIITLSLLIGLTCYAEEIYVEGETSDGTFVSGYLETEGDYAEGYLEDNKGNSFFVDGEVQDDRVWIESPGQSNSYEVYIDK